MNYDSDKNIMIDIYKQLILNKENFTVNEGVHFCLKIDAENYGYEKDGNTYHKKWAKRIVKFFHIILLKRYRVFVSISDDIINGHYCPAPETWKNTSNHDSCWRSDGFRDLSKLYFEMCDEIYKNTPKKHREAPITSAVRFRLNHGWLSGPVFKFVRVEHEALENGNSYHRKLTKIEHIKKTIEM